MRRSAFCPIVLGLSLYGGCKDKTAERTNTPRLPTSAAPTPTPSSAPAAAPVVAPFIVTLEKAESTGQKGAIALRLVVESSKGFGGQTTLTVTLPEGVKLVDGEPREVLQNLPEGKMTRSFKLSPASKLTAEKPARFVVQGQDPAGAFGARAERVYPDEGKR